MNTLSCEKLIKLPEDKKDVYRDFLKKVAAILCFAAERKYNGLN